MTMNKMLLAAGAMALIGVATPVQAKPCWFKCDPSSSSGGGATSSGGGSTGGATPVPEPEQMGIFAMGIALVGYRMFRGRRNKK